MRILLLNCVYREGSTGKIVASLSDTLRTQEHEVMTCYGLGNTHIDEYSQKVCSQMEHNVNAVIGRITGISYGGLHLSNWRVKRIIKTFKPDVVHIHCINASTFNVYGLLHYLAKAGIKTILTLHAEIFHTAGCEHAYECERWKAGCHDCKVYKQRTNSLFFDRSKASYKKMYDAVNAFSSDELTITAVSPWLVDRAKQSAIMKRYKVVYVPNGINTDVFHYKQNVGLIDRSKYKKIVLFVTPHLGMDKNDVKGSHYLTEIASKLPDFKFIVVAGRTDKNMPALPANIQQWGRAKTQVELAQLYSEADVTLLLSRRETFSMVTAESLCCGTQVIGFEAGGPESIAMSCCRFVEQGNVSLLIEALQTIEKLDKEKLSGDALRLYCMNNMCKKYFEVYKSIL